ncbi:OX-2 membrane glycoprotein-like [Xenentodon cancila]
MLKSELETAYDSLDYVLCLNVSVSRAGVTAVIITQPTVVSPVGGEAPLSCQYLDKEDVLQVTWQKVLPNEDKNMASYNELSGQGVNPDFRVKVEFIEAELQRSTIVIRNVSEQDEGCYLCLFITYQHGSVRNKTCLQIYELHEPVLHVEESPEDSLVSCSATGRPAPTVMLTVPQPLYVSHNNTVSVNNTNGTVTVTTTAVLSGLRDNSTTVGCAPQTPCIHNTLLLAVFLV